MKIETCLTPALIDQFNLEGKLVVVVDIFRATSCMVAGLSNDINSIYPVDNVDACLKLGEQGYITAGERGGIKIEEFNIGNSPFEYMNPAFKGRSIAVTTTNGTNALVKSKTARDILVAAFLNISSTANYIMDSGLDLVIHCAGWKGSVNLEDSLFAGALIDLLNPKEIVDDASMMAHSLFQLHKSDLEGLTNASAHAKRLSKFGIKKDLEFCMTLNEYPTVLRYVENEIILHE